MDEEKKTVLRLDGSHGIGLAAHLTIITADRAMGTKETTYEFPYALINFKVLQEAVDSSLILGFRIEKIFPVDQKVLVISQGPEGLSSSMEDN